MRWNKTSSVVRSGWQRGQRTGGFTLIELMVVLVILAISAAIVVPMASSGASMQLRSAVNAVAADLEYAKSLAIGTGQMHGVEFFPDSESYEIFRTVDGNDVRHPVTRRKPYLISFSADGRLDRVSITSANFDGGSVVNFDYLGCPYNSVPSDLASEGVLTLTAGGASKTVKVEPVTGFITVSN